LTTETSMSDRKFLFVLPSQYRYAGSYDLQIRGNWVYARLLKFVADSVAHRVLSADHIDVVPIVTPDNPDEQTPQSRKAYPPQRRACRISHHQYSRNTYRIYWFFPSR